MSSRAQIAALLVVAVAAATSLVAPDGSGKAASPKADHSSAELVECVQGRLAKNRRAIFRGEMTQYGGDDSAARMQMRFALSERFGRGGWAGVSAPGIGVWREARPGIVRFAYRQRVLGLQRGTAYRALVDFRWLAADGQVIHRESDRSPVCRQRGRLPNLKVGSSIGVEPGPTDGTRRYSVRVGNTGLAGASRVALTLRVDGAEVDTRTIRRLRRGDRRVVAFVGPACSERVEATIDPNATIREISERDNTAGSDCQPAG